MAQLKFLVKMKIFSELFGIYLVVIQQKSRVVGVKREEGTDCVEH
jgi:hypothetical protein